MFFALHDRAVKVHVPRDPGARRLHAHLQFGTGAAHDSEGRTRPLPHVFLLIGWTSPALLRTAPGHRRTLGGPAFLPLLRGHILGDWPAVFHVYRNHQGAF